MGLLLVRTLGLVLVLALLPRPADAGLHLVPERGAREAAAAWSVGRVAVRASATGDLAKVRVDLELVNTTRRAMEMTGYVPLPSDQTVGDVAVRFHGERVEAVRPQGAAARELLFEALRRKRDRVLLRFLRRPYLVVPDLVLPPQARRTLSIRYEMTVESIRGVRTLTVPLWGMRGPDGSLPRLDFDIQLRPLASRDKRGGYDVEPTRIGPILGTHHAFTVSRREPGLAQVRGGGEVHPLEPDLQFSWSEGRGPLGMTLLSTWPKDEESGTYLLALRASEPGALAKRPRARDVVWLVDASGSMAGERFDAVKTALIASLTMLGDQDRLQVIAVGDRATSCFERPQALSPATRRAVRRFLDRVRPSGAFDLAAGLTRAALGRPDGVHSRRVVIVTDSRPSVDMALETWEGLLGPEGERARVSAIGLGVDCDALLLDHLAHATGGEAVWIGSRERLDERLPRVLDRWLATSLTEIALRVPGALAGTQHPARLPDLPTGGTLLIAGRYATAGRQEVTVTDRGGPVQRAFGRLLWLAGRGVVDQGEFATRMWAQRQQAALTRRLRTATTPSAREVSELVALTVEHGLLTEHTEWIADEGANHTDVAMNEARCMRGLQDAARTLQDVQALAQVRNEDARRRRTRAPVRMQGSWFPMRGARDLAWVPWPDVRRFGDRIFFYRHRLGWVDSRIDDLADIDAEILRWSESFFALLEATTARENACLAQPGTILLALGERVFRIVDTP